MTSWERAVELFRSYYGREFRTKMELLPILAAEKRMRRGDHVLGRRLGCHRLRIIGFACDGYTIVASEPDWAMSRGFALGSVHKS